MTKAGDSREPAGPGILVLQHSEYMEGFDESQRGQLLAARILDRNILGRAATEELGMTGAWEYDPSTLGDVIGGFHWGALEGRRDMGAWRFSWPVRSQREAKTPDSRLLLGAEVVGPPGLGRAVPSFSDRVKDALQGVWESSEGGEFLNPGQTRSYGPLTFRPIRNAQYSVDSRFRSKELAMPFGTVTEAPAGPTFVPGNLGKTNVEMMPRFPTGMLGLAMAGSEQNNQTDIFLPTDPRLVAPHLGGEPEMGSMVFDVNEAGQLDPEHIGRLQTIFRVIKKPQFCFEALPEGPGENVIALTWGPTGLGESLGGWAWSGEVTGQLSALFEGPIDLGTKGDKHQMGVDADGNPICAAHISLRGQFKLNNAEDGPINISGTRPGGLAGDASGDAVEVHMYFDPEVPYSFCRQTRKGKWRWFVRLNEEPSTPDWFGIFIPPDDPPGGTPPEEPPIRLETPEERRRRLGLPEPGGGGGGGDGAGGDTQGRLGRGSGPGRSAGEGLGPNRGRGGTTTGGPQRPDPFEGPDYPDPDTGPQQPGDGKVQSEWFQDLQTVFSDTERRYTGFRLEDAPRVGMPPVQAAGQTIGAVESFLETTRMRGGPGYIFRPPQIRHGEPDFRWWTDPPKSATLYHKAFNPVVARMESWGPQFGQDGADPTTLGRLSRYGTPTAAGGIIVLPPEMGVEDYLQDFDRIPTALSTAYFLVAKHSSFNVGGLPDFATGETREGWVMRRDLTTDALRVIRGHGGAPTDARTVLRLDAADNVLFDFGVSAAAAIDPGAGNTGVLGIADAAVNPTVTPTGGLISWVDGVNWWMKNDAGRDFILNTIVIDARVHGVIADGVTDDLASIQAAIDAADALGGGIVLLPIGIMIISAKLTLPSHVTLRGQGAGISIIQSQSALATAMISATDALAQFSRTGIESLQFDNLNAATVGGIGIDWTNISTGTIRDVFIQRAEIGLKLDTANARGCFYNNVENYTSSSCETALLLDSVANENFFFGGKHGMASATAIGIHVNDCNSNKFYGISVEGTFLHGFLFGVTAATHMLLSGLRFEGGTNGITTDASYSNDSLVVSPLFSGLTTDLNNLSDTGLTVLAIDHAGNENWVDVVRWADSTAGGTKHSGLARLYVNGSGNALLFRDDADSGFFRTEAARVTVRDDDTLAFELTGDSAGIRWGSTSDVVLYRGGADQLATDDQFKITFAGGKSTLSLSSVAADTGISFGVDTNLYRSAANLLATDDDFDIKRIGGGKDTLRLSNPGTDVGLTIGGDTTLYRDAANVLATDDRFRLAGLGGKTALQIIAADGGLTIGTDTNLYRSAANVLATDDDFFLAVAGKGIQFTTGGPEILEGAGTPEGVVAAAVGSRFMRNDGGTGTATYRKETGGATSSGWVADAAASVPDPLTIVGPLTVTGDGGKVTLALTNIAAGVGLTIGGDVTLYRQAANILATDDRLDIAIVGAGKDTLKLSSVGADTGITFGTDVTLYRDAANILATDDAFRIQAGTKNALQIIGADGGLTIGTDTTLYRSAANVLKTDDRLCIGINGGDTTLELDNVAAGVGLRIGGDTNLYRSGANNLATDDVFSVTVNGLKNSFNITNTTANTGLTIGGDTNLYRPSADILKTDDRLDVGISGGPTTLALSSTVVGVGMTIGGDTNLYRGAVNELKTDDQFEIAGSNGTLTLHLSSTTFGVGLRIGADVDLYRAAANLLALDDEFDITPAGGRNTLRLSSNGTDTGITLGNGGTAVEIYRSAANTLSTNSAILSSFAGGKNTLQLTASITADTGITMGADVNIYRDVPNVLATDDDFRLAVSGKLIEFTGGGATISSGSAAPTAAEPDGSIYLRTGASGELYLRDAGSWVQVA